MQKADFQQSLEGSIRIITVNFNSLDSGRLAALNKFMRLGFTDAEELRTRHAALKARRVLERALLLQAVDSTHQAVAHSWNTLGLSKAMVEAADRFNREREIQVLADDFLKQECALLAMKDDGQILAAIFPAQRAR